MERSKQLLDFPRYRKVPMEAAWNRAEAREYSCASRAPFELVTPITMTGTLSEIWEAGNIVLSLTST